MPNASARPPLPGARGRKGAARSRNGYGALTERSRTEWAIRAVLAAIAAWIGYFVTCHSLAFAMADSRPEFAHRLAPGSAPVAAKLSVALAKPDAPASDLARASQLAGAAVSRDPTVADAVGTLGLIALMRGDAAKARPLFLYSERLTRRDLRVQLWAIEDAVARGDVENALRHYDIALRTKPGVSDALFPVLTVAVTEPEVQNGLTRMMAANRPFWAPSFFLHASANAEPGAALSLFRKLGAAGVDVTEEPRARLIGALLSAGSAADAWNYYAERHPGLDRRVSRDPRFRSQLAIPTAFDWTPMSDSGAATEIQPETGGNGVFIFSVPPSVGGLLLKQLEVLPPGNYVLEGRSARVTQPRSSLPYWSLSCHQGAELGRIVVPSSGDAEGRFAGGFTVPAGCPVQVLALVAQPSNEIAGTSGEISEVSLRPAR